MKPLSLCIVSQQYKSVISGIGLHTRNLVSGLIKDGHRVILLTQENQGLEAPDKALTIVTVPAAFFQKSQARWLALSWSFAGMLRTLLSQEHFDIIHFTDARESLWFRRHPAVIGNVNDYYAAKVMPYSYYKRYYTDARERWAYYHFLHRCEKIAFQHLTALIANSRYTLETICRQYHLPAEKLFQCYKSINLDLFKQQPTPPTGGKSILFAGGNMQRKGLRTLIHAASKIEKEVGPVIFNIVGADRNLNTLKILAQEAGVADRFFFHGGLPNEALLSLFSRTHLFVMPSLVEAFGMVLLEAMATGIPVVTTKVGGIPELIGDEENGLLVSPDSPDEFADAVVAVLNSPTLHKKLAVNGRKRAAQFGLGAMMECTYGVYGAILDR